REGPRARAARRDVRGNRGATRPRCVPARQSAVSRGRSRMVRADGDRKWGRRLSRKWGQRRLSAKASGMNDASRGKSSPTPLSVPRADYAAIGNWVDDGAHVLDLGCGDGALLAFLSAHRHASGYGIEIDDAGVLACV